MRCRFEGIFADSISPVNFPDGIFPDGFCRRNIPDGFFADGFFWEFFLLHSSTTLAL